MQRDMSRRVIKTYFAGAPNELCALRRTGTIDDKLKGSIWEFQMGRSLSAVWALSGSYNSLAGGQDYGVKMASSQN